MEKAYDSGKDFEACNEAAAVIFDLPNTWRESDAGASGSRPLYRNVDGLWMADPSVPGRTGGRRTLCA
jgi:hypothetical protein